MGGGKVGAVRVDCVGEVHVRSPVQQEMGHLQIVTLDGHHQWGLAVILLGRGFGKAGNQIWLFIQNQGNLVQLTLTDGSKQLFHGRSSFKGQSPVAELLWAKYTTTAKDIQPSFLNPDSSSKQCTGIYPVQLVGGRRPPSPQCIGAAPPDAQAAVGVCWYIPAGDGHPRRSRPRRAHSRRQAVPPSALGRQRERSAQVIPGRSCFGSFLLVDHRLSSLFHFATNEPSANVM